MATFAKINDFLEHVHEQVHDLRGTGGDTITLALSNTAPSAETPDPRSNGNGILTNVSQISYTYYSDDLAVTRVLTAANITSAVAGAAGSGTYTFDYTADIVITASGGALDTFQYIYLYNDTPTSPVDPLIGVWDHGSAITLASSEQATIQWNASGIFTVA